VLESTNRSRLTLAQQWALRVTVGLGAFMIANTLYLLVNRLIDTMGWRSVTAGEATLPKWFQLQILSHTGVGIVLAVVATAFALWHLTRVWIRRRNRTALLTGIVVLTLGLVLTATGLLIISEANSRGNRLAYWLHVVTAVLVPLIYIWHRRSSIWRPTMLVQKRVVRVVIAATVVFLAGHWISSGESDLTAEAEVALSRGAHTGPGSKLRDLSIYADSSGLVPAAYVPEDSPFFPSATTTTTGDFLPSRIITRGDLGERPSLNADLDSLGFVTETRIGAETCERCHQDVTEQWASSAHRFASFNNPFYEATVNLLRETADNGMEKSKWCSGCHDPSLMLAGQMDKPVDRRTAEAQAGLTCLACHAIDSVHNRTGNANYNIADEREDPYLFPNAKEGLGLLMHDTALKARPLVHKQQLQKPVFKSAEFCATCHKVSLDEQVNGYRWLRAQNEYDAWHDSGVSRNASRTFYLPQTKRVCQDCHMPLEPAPLGDLAAKQGLIKSHRFTAVNTALPFIRGDQETIERIERFVRDEKLSVDVLALRGGERFEHLVAPLDRTSALIQAGEEVQIDVVVRNKGVGHTFPGGTNDSNQGWIEFTVIDDEGNTILATGLVDEHRVVDPDARFYHAVLVDKDGKRIRRRDGHNIHTAVYSRTIGPGTADVGRYRFRIPKSSGGRRLIVKARLLWRKFDRAYTEFAYRSNPEGFKRFDDVPDLPIMEIASDSVALRVSSVAVSGAVQATSDDWMRFNDYGIGLLLQGDTRSAVQAFELVKEADPGRVDGYRNLARIAVSEGNIQAALDHLERCETIAPGDPQTAWVWGTAHQRAGRYDEAAGAYERVLRVFPEDRAAWRNLGRVRYLNGDFEKALAALDQVLEIDPEDRTAHYHRMLALRALGRKDEASKAERAYLKYQIDESAKSVTQVFLLEHPEVERAAQRIQIHYPRPNGPEQGSRPTH
jgi:tetratricopeptide (TPR) repeat protein